MSKEPMQYPPYWIAGWDTLKIARHFAVSEAVVYNLLSKWKDAKAATQNKKKASLAGKSGLNSASMESGDAC